MNVWENIKTTFRRGDALVKLIYVNAGVFLALKVAVIVLKLFNLPGLPLYSWLAMPADPLALLHRPWTLITYMFLHEGFFHLFFNMLCLYWFGKLFLTVYNNSADSYSYSVPEVVTGFVVAVKDHIGNVKSCRLRRINLTAGNRVTTDSLFLHYSVYSFVRKRL